MNKNKKLLLSLGSIAAIAAPVAAVVACGSNKNQGNDEVKELAATKVNFVAMGHFNSNSTWAFIDSAIQELQKYNVYSAEFKFDAGLHTLVGGSVDGTLPESASTDKLDQIETALNTHAASNQHPGNPIRLGTYKASKDAQNDTIITLLVSGFANRDAVKIFLDDFNAKVNESNSKIFTGSDANDLKAIWNKMHYLLQLKDLEFQVGLLQKIADGLDKDAQDASSAFQLIHDLVDSRKSNTEVTEEQVATALNSIDGISGIKPSEIALDTSMPGTLKITVNHPGMDVRTITLEGFKNS